MRNCALLALALLSLCSLRGQDFEYGPLAWLSLDDAPDVLPVPKGLPGLEIPDDQKAVHEPGYVELHISVSAKGRAGIWSAAATSPWLPKHTPDLSHEFVPAKRDGSAVNSEVALFAIYNPPEASLKGSTAIPRLLAVQPPVYPEGHKNVAADAMVRVRAEIDSKGAVIGATALTGPDEEFGAAAVAAVKRWSFAPAREKGQPVAANLEVNVVFEKPAVFLSGNVTVPPKPITRGAPVYPYYLRRAGIPGEVRVDFVINVEGRVTEAFAVKSDHPDFEEAALAAIRSWRFLPAEKDGRPVAFSVSQLLQFSTDDGPGHDGAYDFKVHVPKTWPASLPEALRFDVAPRLEIMVSPVYPLDDLRTKRSGKVTLAYVIDPRGKVGEITPIPGTATPAMVNAAVAALEQFQFTPAGRKGKPSYAMLRIDFEFSPDGYTGNAPVTDATKRILRLLEKPDERLTKASQLDSPVKARSTLIANEANRKGRAALEFVIDRDGIPRAPRVISATDPALGAAAVQAVAGWRFYPPKAGGRVVDTLVRLPVEFK